MGLPVSRYAQEAGFSAAREAAKACTPAKVGLDTMQVVTRFGQAAKGFVSLKFNSNITVVLHCATFCFLLGTQPASLQGQEAFLTNSRLQLGTESNLSASVRAGDLDGDGDMDIVVANGRHWPQQNYIFLNGERGQFTQMRPLGKDRSTTYACELADLDGDGDLDIVTGNAMAPCRIFLNDGQANFTSEQTLSDISSIRSITLADIDVDDDIDILATCRGRPNLIFRNKGGAIFSKPQRFGSFKDSTIDVAVEDLNDDARPDLLLANRDRQPNTSLLQGDDSKFESQELNPAANDTRALVTADFNGDGIIDCAVGNIREQNQVFFGSPTGQFDAGPKFGAATGQTYCLAAADINGDGSTDIVAGNVGSRNKVCLNLDWANDFHELEFGSSETATYGLCVADFDGDRRPDIAVANSGAVNRIFINRTQTKPTVGASAIVEPDKSVGDSSNTTRDLIPNQNRPNQTSKETSQDWPRFRGQGGQGIGEGFPLPSEWLAKSDEEQSAEVLWTQPVRGLSHSCPVIVGNRLFLATAVSSSGEAPLQVGRGGAPTAAEDNEVQSWQILCFDKSTGKELWSRTVHAGVPKATRHAKATHANSTLTIQGDSLVAFFGSEGLYCYNLGGDLRWKRDLGIVNISKYGIGWGYASSPAVFEDRIVLICDDPSNPYLVALELGTGEEIWRVDRKGDCDRNWSTPLIFEDSTGTTQVVVNGWPSVVSYDLADGKELWRIRDGGDNPVPTPFLAKEHIFVSSAHGPMSPIYVVKPSARGDLTDKREDSDSFLWSVDRGGCYMSTPIVYGDYLYLGNSNGVLRCFHATTGEKLYEQRLAGDAGIIASLVAGDGKIYCASENGKVYVVHASPEFELLATNTMPNPLFATPAISQGIIYFRTTKELIAVGSKPSNAETSRGEKR